MTEDQKRMRAESARMVIENPIYQEAWIAIRTDLFNDFIKTAFEDKDKRDEIWLQMNSIDRLEKQFKYFMNTGRRLDIQEKLNPKL